MRLDFVTAAKVQFPDITPGGDTPDCVGQFVLPQKEAESAVNMADSGVTGEFEECFTAGFWYTLQIFS